MFERRPEQGQGARRIAPPQMMIREEVRIFATLRALPGLERLGEQRVVLLPQSVGEVGGDDLQDLVMVEAVVRPDRAHDARPSLDLREVLQHRDPLAFEHSREVIGIELVALHGARVEQRPLCLRQVREPPLDQVAHRARNLDLLDDPRLDPRSVGPLGEELALPKPADHLEDEERHAVRLQGDGAGEAVRQRLAPEGILEELHDLPCRESPDRQAAEGVEPAEMGGFVLGQAGPGRADEQRTVSGDGTGEGEEEMATVGRREVEVVDHPDEWLLRRQSLHQLHHDGRQGIAFDSRTALRGRLVSEERRQGRDERARGVEVLAKPFLESGRTEVVADRIGDPAHASGRGIAAVEDVDAFVSEVTEEGIHEPCLSDPGLALEQDRIAPAVARALPGRTQHAEALVAAMQRRLPSHRDLRHVGRGQQDLRLPGDPPVGRLSGRQHLAQESRRRQAIGGGLRRQRREDLREERRDVGNDLVRSNGNLVQVRGDDFGRAVVAKGMRGRCQLVEEQAERVDVRRRADLRVLPELLRRSVEQRPGELSLARQLDRAFDQARDAEIHEPHVVIRRDQDVLRLQVPVDDPFCMDRVEAGRDLSRDFPQERLGHDAEFVLQFAQRPPLDVFHHQEMEGLPVHLEGVGVQGRDDVLVAHPATEVGLPQEALEEAVLSEEVRVDQLDGDGRTRVPAELRFRQPRAPDGPHPARAEFLFDPVAAEERPLHGGTVHRLSTRKASASRFRRTG